MLLLVSFSGMAHRAEPTCYTVRDRRTYKRTTAPDREAELAAFLKVQRLERCKSCLPIREEAE